jgi:hypothetical protein
MHHYIKGKEGHQKDQNMYKGKASSRWPKAKIQELIHKEKLKPITTKKNQLELFKP